MSHNAAYQFFRDQQAKREMGIRLAGDCLFGVHQHQPQHADTDSPQVEYETRPRRARKINHPAAERADLNGA